MKITFSGNPTFVGERANIAAVWLTFIGLLASFNHIYSGFFRFDGFQIGSDYSFMFPAWLDGLIWFRNNGLDVPWFSPSFCAGQPFFADPQSTYYSIPQFINFVASPLNTAALTLLLSASLMYWGGYLLMRRVFLTTPAVSAMVGGILMFNGFLPHRILAGHITFHGFSMVPWVCLLLLVPFRSRLNGNIAAMAAGIVVAYWVQSGFGSLVLAGGLSIVLVALLAGLQGKPLSTFVVRSTIASAIAIGLSIAKLWAAFSFLANFPRTDYLIPGAASLADAVVVIAGGLFLPPLWSFDLGAPRLVNTQWVLGPHEWAYNFGFISAGLGVILAADWLRLGGIRVLATRRQQVLFSLLLLCLAWPLAFNIWEPSWSGFLKSIPVINSTSAPIRWLIVYIPIVAVVIGLLLDRLKKWPALVVPLVASCLLLTVVQAAYEPRDPSKTQRYDARPLSIADSMLRTDQLKPGIKSLGTSVDVRVSGVQIPLGLNDTIFAGVSQVFCYNPVFGYRLEKFSATNLRIGPVLAVHDGYLNLKNPACYVYPKENDCKPGDLFKANQLKQATAFVNYRPFAFYFSNGQIIANCISRVTLFIVMLSILGWMGKGAITAMRNKS